MATRISWPGTVNTGDVVTEANLDSLPGSWIGYIDRITDSSSVTSETDLSGLTITPTVGSSRRIRISARGILVKSAASTRSIIRIKEGTTELCQIIVGHVTTGNQSFDGFVLLPNAAQTLTSGAHTYKLTLESLDSGNVTLKGTASPAFLLVEDIGAQ